MRHATLTAIAFVLVLGMSTTALAQFDAYSFGCRSVVCATSGQRGYGDGFGGGGFYGYGGPNFIGLSNGHDTGAKIVQGVMAADATLTYLPALLHMGREIFGGGNSDANGSNGDTAQGQHHPNRCDIYLANRSQHSACMQGLAEQAREDYERGLEEAHSYGRSGIITTGDN